MKDYCKRHPTYFWIQKNCKLVTQSWSFIHSSPGSWSSETMGLVKKHDKSVALRISCSQSLPGLSSCESGSRFGGQGASVYKGRKAIYLDKNSARSCSEMAALLFWTALTKAGSRWGNLSGSYWKPAPPGFVWIVQTLRGLSLDCVLFSRWSKARRCTHFGGLYSGGWDSKSMGLNKIHAEVFLIPSPGSFWCRVQGSAK